MDELRKAIQGVDFSLLIIILLLSGMSCTMRDMVYELKRANDLAYPESTPEEVQP